MKTFLRTVCLAVLFAIVNPLSASSLEPDLLMLTNGSYFEGKALKIKKCNLHFAMNDTLYIIPTEDINYLSFGDETDKVYTDYLELSNQEQNKCLAARLDAENYHGKKGGHFILGVLFGPFAMIGTALSEPTPYRGKNTLAMSENKELFNNPEYLSCYKKKAKGQLIGAEAFGWASWILFVLVAL